MTKQEFENKEFEEIMVQLAEEKNDIMTYEKLVEFVKCKIDSDDLFVAIHILEALRNDCVRWYEYDCFMGTLQEPLPITEKLDKV